MSEVLTALLPLAEAAGASVATLAALFTRLSLFMLMLPGIAGRAIPVRIRLSFAIALTLLLLPLAGNGVAAVSAADYTPLLAGEAMIGFALGFALRAFLFALNITGTIVAQALSLSQIFGATAEGDSASLISQALTMAGAALFLTAGFGEASIGLFARQLEAVPLGGLTADPAEIAANATAVASSMIALGVMLALPFMVLNFAFYVLLGLLNRAMPQLMVTFVGLPALTLCGFVLFALSVGALLSVWLSRVAGLLP